VIFVADENIDTEIIEELKKGGYNILSISDECPGVPDEEVLRIANDHNAILLTGDKDFGELIFRRGLESSGVILVRIFGVSQEEKAHKIYQVFKQHAEDFINSFTVIGKNKTRIKRIN
jgi:predicted nuclease of predicted toxin-antitoxin system